MSVFTIEHARQFAANAFRFLPSLDERKPIGKARRPLVGKERGLLDALRAGEQRYHHCKAEIRVIRKLRKSDAELPQRCAEMAHRLEEIIGSLSSLDSVSRDELDSIAFCQGTSFENIRHHLEKALCWAEEGAKELFQRRPKTAGRKLGVGKEGVQLVPLEEFAKEIREFWLQEVGRPFSFEAITRDDLDPIVREPVSAAARLLHQAARTLDPRVDVGHVEALMRAVSRYPEPRKELLGDPAVDALTS